MRGIDILQLREGPEAQQSAVRPGRVRRGLALAVFRSTIYRAFKSGRMSAARLEIGQIEVDPADFERSQSQGKFACRPRGSRSNTPGRISSLHF
jgi:hypothetical protein